MTYSQSIAAATGGKVHLPANMLPGKQARQLIQTEVYSSPSSSSGPSPYLSGYPYIEIFQNANDGGQSLTYTASSPVCTNGNVYGVSLIGTNSNGFNMNDQTSSLELFGQCNASVLFQASDYNNFSNGGSLFADESGDTNVTGVMNDQASSFVVASDCSTISACFAF